MLWTEQSHRADDGRGFRADGSSRRPERWARVKALFLEALEYSEPERVAFLVGATGEDADLRREVEALLASDAEAGSFCEVPAADLLGTFEPEQSPSRFAPGTRLGAYEITGFIAAGGMGAVYRARHTVLGREVAIKTVSPGANVGTDRKSTRLNSSHVEISYAVFG